MHDVETDAAPTTPEEITARVRASFEQAPDDRLREVMTALVSHLHAFAQEVHLTQREWERAIAILTRTGEITDERRQEFILWSDSLGLSMLVDALEHELPAGATESTVLGPFYVPGAPVREYGADMRERATHMSERGEATKASADGAGTPAVVQGRVLDLQGRPIVGAELDVWQNGPDRLYAVQQPEGPEGHLRGRFITRDDGSYRFIGIRPTSYPIPFDGPVGAMLEATGRHPWRPAHLHMIVRAPGYRALTTHIFDDASDYLDSDAVFAVKPTLRRTFVEHGPDDPGTPDRVSGEWVSVENDIVLVSVDEH
jgi:catechol 1,2-dioxygenase